MPADQEQRMGVMIGTTLVKTPNWFWDVSANFTRNRKKVGEM
jgi:hypothetical protein